MQPAMGWRSSPTERTTTLSIVCRISHESFLSRVALQSHQKVEGADESFCHSHPTTPLSRSREGLWRAMKRNTWNL
jgi:hypothetical protein